MRDDDIFRLILTLGFAAVFPIALYHRLKSQATGEKLDRRQEGTFILLTLRPIAAMRMLGVLTYIINPAWMAWSSIGLPGWARWLGVGLGVVAATLLIIVFRTLGTNLTDTVVTRVNHTLVTTGPYRYVRHPFYVVFALAVTADSLVTDNAFLALTGLTAFGLIILRTRTEEEKLIERFGEEYRRYMSRTARFLPRFRSRD